MSWKNLISLYQSCVLRRRHLRRYSKDPLSNQIIEIKLNKREHIPQAAYYDVIHDLSRLFRAYTHSLRDQAYCKDLPRSVNPYHLEILDQVYTRVSKLPSAIQPLVFWHLFTAATSKLAHGKLQSFRFMPKKYAPSDQKKSPDDFQYNRTKKSCWTFNSSTIYSMCCLQMTASMPNSIFTSSPTLTVFRISKRLRPKLPQKPLYFQPISSLWWLCWSIRWSDPLPHWPLYPSFCLLAQSWTSSKHFIDQSHGFTQHSATLWCIFVAN